ncbi:MAG: hypothetical protein HOV78_11670 [Hamadaea sp.]|nr:hypothetical protein [Hamadaea sp.]
MVDLITLEEIQNGHENGASWTDAQKARGGTLLAGVLDWIGRNAKCLIVNPDPNAPGKAEARMIVSEAILRAIDSTGNVGSENIGPSQVNYIDRAALPTLTKADEASLKALCGKSRRRRYGSIRITAGY